MTAYSKPLEGPTIDSYANEHVVAKRIEISVGWAVLGSRWERLMEFLQWTANSWVFRGCL
jgi:hypothetical protein